MNFKDIEFMRAEEHRLESIEVGLTSQCNFKCKYCCAYRKANDPVMSAEQIAEIIKELPDLKRLKLSGGEVLLYFDECVKTVEYASSRGIATQINTNGSVLNEEKIDILASAGLSTLHISLNFKDPDTFSTFYGVNEEIFSTIVKNIRYAAKICSMNTVVETIIFNKTEDILPDVHNFIYDLGVRMHEIQYGIPISRNSWFSGTSFEKLEKVIQNVCIHKKSDCKLYFSCMEVDCCNFSKETKEIIGREGIYFPSCIEGRKQVHIHSNKDVLICELGYPVVIGNLDDGLNLNEIFLNKPKALREFLVRHNCNKNLKNIFLHRTSMKSIPYSREKYSLVEIPSNSFIMGNGDGDGFEQEKPAHEVVLDSYYIGKYAVTVREYYDFMIDVGKEFNELWCDFINPCFIIKDGDTYRMWEGADNYPMVQVSYVGAIAYCNWCSLKNDLEPVYDLNTLTSDLTKNGFRLPTEAEWEYACGGPKNYTYSICNDFYPELFNYKHYSGEFAKLRASHKRIGGFGLTDYSPLPAGTLPPNSFGIHEMLGNVNEWCNDGYGLYSEEKQVNPVGNTKSSFRVIRGGCFMDDKDKIRKTYRHAIHYEAKCMIDGFRIAKNI